MQSQNDSLVQQKYKSNEIQKFNICIVLDCSVFPDRQTHARADVDGALALLIGYTVRSRVSCLF